MKIKTNVLVGATGHLGGFEEWLRSLRQLGLDVLLNEHRAIRRDDVRLVLAGVTDPAALSHQQVEALFPGTICQHALLCGKRARQHVENPGVGGLRNVEAQEVTRAQ